MMNYIFWGGKAIGNYVLNGLIENGYVPKGIILYKDIIDQELIKKADSLNIKVLKIHSFHKQQDDLELFIIKLNVDLFISVAFPFILPSRILKLVKYPINIHTGAIPKYRGHHPLSAALLNDEPYQATTVHFMTEEVDAGDILLQDFVPIKNEDSILTIRQKLIELSLNLILTVLKQLKNGTLYPKKQIGEIIWAPKRNPEDSRVDFTKTSRYLHNFIRALVDPYPNAFAFKKGDKIVKFKKSITSNKPGVVLADLGQNHYIISTSDGIVYVETDAKLIVGEELQ
ncbi:MAG TPA: hypothetical protein DCG75_17475 [Bacteroidales bacterium]|nr:hypothetical protein [Bacteroidales bacterium]